MAILINGVDMQKLIDSLQIRMEKIEKEIEILKSKNSIINSTNCYIGTKDKR